MNFLNYVALIEYKILVADCSDMIYSIVSLPKTMDKINSLVSDVTLLTRGKRNRNFRKLINVIRLRGNILDKSEVLWS